MISSIEALDSHDDNFCLQSLVTLSQSMQIHESKSNGYGHKKKVGDPIIVSKYRRVIIIF